KARYDRFGHAGVGGAAGGGRGPSMDDIFSNFGDIFGDDMFGSFFGGGRQNGGRRQGTRGSNLRVKLKMNYADIAHGAQKKIKVKKHVSCDVCNGTGAKDRNSVQTCGSC